MTDNEKAATFVGWRPNAPCTDHPSITRVVATEHCTLSAMMVHDVLAPDMSKPENYMRALESLNNYEMSRDERLGCAVAIPDFGHAEGRTFTTMAEAAVAALAALYAAEHKEEAHDQALPR